MTRARRESSSSTARGAELKGGFQQLGVLLGVLLGVAACAGLRQPSLVAALPVVLGGVSSVVLASWLIVEPKVQGRRIFVLAWALLLGVVLFFPTGRVVRLLLVAGGFALWEWGSLEQTWVKQVLAAAPLVVAAAGALWVEASGVDGD